MFVTAFNSHRGFPYDVRLSEDVEPFATEEGAARLATDLSLKTIDEAR